MIPEECLRGNGEELLQTASERELSPESTINAIRYCALKLLTFH